MVLLEAFEPKIEPLILDNKEVYLGKINKEKESQQQPPAACAYFAFLPPSACSETGRERL